MKLGDTVYVRGVLVEQRLTKRNYYRPDLGQEKEPRDAKPSISYVVSVEQGGNEKLDIVVPGSEVVIIQTNKDEKK